MDQVLQSLSSFLIFIIWRWIPEVNPTVESMSLIILDHTLF
jgi:hypothetical protein